MFTENSHLANNESIVKKIVGISLKDKSAYSYHLVINTLKQQIEGCHNIDDVFLKIMKITLKTSDLCNVDVRMAKIEICSFFLVDDFMFIEFIYDPHLDTDSLETNFEKASFISKHDFFPATIGFSSHPAKLYSNCILIEMMVCHEAEQNMLEMQSILANAFPTFFDNSLRKITGKELEEYKKYATNLLY